VGDTYNSLSDATVSATDMAIIQSGYSATASLASHFDIDRNGIVEDADVQITAENPTNFISVLNLIVVP
jgi:hypothetical protein